MLRNVNEIKPQSLAYLRQVEGTSQDGMASSHHFQYQGSWARPQSQWLKSLTAGTSHATFIVAQGPMHRGALGFMLWCHLEILNNFISELVFRKWSQMEPWHVTWSRGTVTLSACSFLPPFTWSIQDALWAQNSSGATKSGHQQDSKWGQGKCALSTTEEVMALKASRDHAFNSNLNLMRWETSQWHSKKLKLPSGLSHAF